MPEHLSHQPYDYGDPAGGEPTLGVGQPAQPRETVGSLLRRTRERYRLHLHEAADQLRIRAAYLDAIERSEFRELPGPTYAVGFVRSYADFLGLDENEIVRRFKDEVEGINRAQQLHFPKPVNEAKVPGGAILLISLVLVAAAYGGWYYLTREGRSVSDLVPAVPERLQALLGTSSPAEGGGTVVADASPSGGTAGQATGAGGGAADSESGAEAFRSAESPQPADSPEVGGEQPASDGDEEVAAARAETGSGSDTVEPAAGEAEPPPAPSEEADDPSRVDSDTDGPPAAPTETADASAETTDGATSSAPNQAAQAAETAEPGDVQTSGAETEGASAARGGAAETAAPADDASDDGGPPAVPQSGDSQGDADSAIPAAPTGTQTASASDGGGRVFGAGNADARIILRATADSWVQVRGPDDSLLLTRVLHAGDVYRVPNRDGLILHTGNAGGLEVSVDGSPVASLGEAGEVRRNIPLVPAELPR